MSSRSESFAILCLLVSVLALAYLVWLSRGELELVGGRLDELELEHRIAIEKVLQRVTAAPAVRARAPRKPRTPKGVTDGDTNAT